MRSPHFARSLLLLAVLASAASAVTYPNRIWHYPSGSDPYYTIEAITLTADTTWDAAASPVVCEADVSVAEGVTLTVPSGASLQFVPLAGLYVKGTLAASSATFARAGSDPWKGIYLAPTAGASTLSACTIDSSGGVGYCYYGCHGLGTYHDAVRFAAIYIDGCNATVTGCSITNTYGNAIEIWGGVPTITNNAIANVGSGSFAILYDNADVFPVIGGNSGSGTGQMGVRVPGATMAASGRWPVVGATLPYLITGHLTVGSGATLTIDPGVTVLADAGDTGVHVLGTLKAEGTSGAPIVFASRKAAPEAGDWNGIYLGPDAGASVIRRCEIRNAGGLGYCYYGCRGHAIANGQGKFSAIFVDACSPVIESNVITGTYGHGIEIWNGSAVIKDNQFSNLRAESYVVALDTIDTFPVMSGNTLAGTGTAGVSSPGGATATGGTWNVPGPGLSWYLGSSLSVPEGKTLAIAPGNTIFMPPGNAGVYVAGTLNAGGSPAAPVTFTSRAATKSAGDWNGIYLAPTAGASSLAHARIQFAGGLGYCYYGCTGLGTYNGAVRTASLYVDASSPTLDGLAVSDSYGEGIEIFNSSAPLNGVTIQRAQGVGLRLDGGASPAVTNTTIADCGSRNCWAVSLDAACRPNPTGVSLTGNKYQGVEVRGGSFAGATTWKRWATNTPYVVDGSITVPAGVRLTIEPGVTLKNWNAGIYVYGTLHADGGTADITFTSLRDDTVDGDSDANGSSAGPSSGQWLGIYFGPDAGASVLNHCNIRYPSSYNNGTGLIHVHGEARYTAIFVDGCSPTITGCDIRSIYGHGIELWASRAVIQNNSISDLNSSSWSIVQRTTDTFPVYAGNAASGTGNIGVWATGGEMTASGRRYLPGPSLPYYTPGVLSVMEGATLTIDPGVTSQFNGALHVYGTLIAAGTAAQPITFNSRAGTGPGQWLGVYLAPTAGASKLEWLRLYNGAAYNYDTGLIYVHGVGHNCMLLVDSCSPALDNIIVRSSNYDGLVLWASNSAVRNSAFTGCGWSGVAVKASSSPAIINVTSAGNDTGIWTENSSMTVVNCIIAANRLGISAGGTNAPVFRNTDVYGNSNGNFVNVPDPGTANGNISQDPLFIAVASGNCRIQAGSPCIDAGDDSANPGTGLDVQGQPRKQGAHIDMGAWEAPVSSYYGWADVRDALKIAGGAKNASAADVARLNLVAGGGVNAADAVKVLRKVIGVEPNP